MKALPVLVLAMLAGCASPPPPTTPTAAATVSAGARIADELAISVRDLAGMKTRYGDRHPEVVRLEAAQVSLQQSGREASAAFADEFREAAKFQLAIAQRERAELALRYGEAHPDMIRSAAVIAALTEAANGADQP